MTSATSDVKAAVENLEEKSGMNFLLIGGIAAGVIVVVVVIIIIVVSSNSKKKKKAQAGNGNVPPSGMPQQPNGAVVPRTVHRNSRKRLTHSRIRQSRMEQARLLCLIREQAKQRYLTEQEALI